VISVGSFIGTLGIYWEPFFALSSQTAIKTVYQQLLIAASDNDAEFCLRGDILLVPSFPDNNTYDLAMVTSILFGMFGLLRLLVNLRKS